MGAHISRLISSRIPTAEGEFTLHLYRARGEDKDHLALTLGDVTSDPGVLVRIHSECFTGDVLASRRCDCGEQLERASRLIAREGRGILVYLRQEGRGIGLLEKLKAYNLQDQGHDTVEANELLGHQADERDYGVAAAILRDLGLEADSEIRLLTNNPAKIESLVELGFPRCRRVALQTPIRSENFHYLATKARRMRHLLHVGPRPATIGGNGDDDAHAEAALASAAPLNLLTPVQMNGRPSITLTYAQSLDGSITVRRGESMTLSGPESMTLTHALRAQHDGILVGIETVLTDDPRLTVRLVEGPDPQPVVLDSRLRTPIGARIFRHPTLRPWVATTTAAETSRERALVEAGATVLRVEPNAEGQVDLVALLPLLRERGMSSLMVEGGARVITSFLAARAVDRLVLTIAPLLVGGLNAVGDLAKRNGKAFPKLRNPRYQWLGPDLVLLGDLHGELERSLDHAVARQLSRELED